MKKRLLRDRRHKRIRSEIKGTAKRPRLSVSRSSKHIYAQLIDDSVGKTLLKADDIELKITGKTKVEVAMEVGSLIAKKAMEKKITNVVFDRGGFKYIGRVKAIAEGARKGGLKF